MKVIVNDVELDLKPGTSVIDAVFAAGHDVPYFCSLPYMSPIGACRMCLAKIGAPRKDRATGDWIKDEETGEAKIFYFPKLMATCTTAVMEGMVVDTLSKEVKDAQNAMVEFTLINHPLDCPVCDKGGACELQDRSYEYGTGISRFQFDKRHQEKHAKLSPLITLDRERCIHCKRCVRYFEEVPGDEVLDFIERGGHTYIGTADEKLPSNFTGNITDMCPVGALLDRTSRFRGRNWEYDHTRTTSLHDASGSAIMVDARTGRIERVKAARNTQVNLDWIDDGARFSHEYVDAEDRLKTPLLRKDGELVPVSWEEACTLITEKLKDLVPDEVGIAIRADATLEEGVAAKALAERFNSGLVDHFPRYPSSVIPRAPQASFTELATSDGILVIGDVTEEVPIVDLRIKDALKGVPPAELLAHGVPLADLRLKERMPKKRHILSVAAPYHVDLMNHAGRALRYATGKEAELATALTQLAQGKSAPKEVAGLDAALLAEAAKSLKDAEKPVIVYGGFVLSNPDASDKVNALAEATGAKVMALGPMANSYGLEHLGVTPQRGDYQSMLQGGLRALILSGLNPAQDTAVARHLRQLELLVVHASFQNETTDLAHVILPAKTGFEKEGTVVNLEGRYLNLFPAPVNSGSSEDFTGVVKALGDALATRLDGRSVRSARRALKKVLELDPDELPPEGLWHPETSRQRSASSVITVPGANVLLVPSMVKPELIRRNPKLHEVYGDPALRINPVDASARNLSEGDPVRLLVGTLPRRAVVRITEAVPEGLMLLPSLADQPSALAVVDMITVERPVAEVSA